LFDVAKSTVNAVPSDKLSLLCLTIRRGWTRRARCHHRSSTRTSALCSDNLSCRRRCLDGERQPLLSGRKSHSFHKCRLLRREEIRGEQREPLVCTTSSISRTSACSVPSMASRNTATGLSALFSSATVVPIPLPDSAPSGSGNAGDDFPELSFGEGAVSLGAHVAFAFHSERKLRHHLIRRSLDD
jgi:hypothetical protein